MLKVIIVSPDKEMQTEYEIDEFRVNEFHISLQQVAANLGYYLIPIRLDAHICTLCERELGAECVIHSGKMYHEACVEKLVLPKLNENDDIEDVK